VTPETCRVILQYTKSDCMLLHLVGFYLILNYDERKHDLKKILKYDCIMKTGILSPFVGVYRSGAKGNIKHLALGFTTTTAVNS